MPHRLALTTDRNGLFDITDGVNSALVESGVVDGVVVVTTTHTTAALTITSYHDPLGLEDVHDELCRLIPTRIDFKHQYDTPQDAAAHVKAAIVGSSCSLIVEGGALCLGSSQKIYFWEFDAPRQRSVLIRPLAG